MRCADAALLEDARALLPPGAAAVAFSSRAPTFTLLAGDTPGRLALRFGRARRSPPLDRAAALDALEGEVRLYVAARAPRHLFVHAGVVAWSGRAIVLPGRTLAGKSTLVAALLRAGAIYLSDEYAVLDPDGRVRPYPRALRIREGGSLAGRPVAPETFGAQVAPDAPLPVALVAALRHREGAAFAPAPMTTGEIVLALLDNTVAARRAHARALPILRALALGARGLKGERGEAEAAARALLDAIS